LADGRTEEVISSNNWSPRMRAPDKEKWGQKRK